MNRYIENKYKIILTYVDGKLAVMAMLPHADMIDWEAIRDEIPYYEEALNKEKYTLIK